MGEAETGAVRAGFGISGREYDQYHRDHPLISDYMLRSVAKFREGRMLDVGAGTGNETIRMASQVSGPVVGVDPTLSMLSQAVRKSGSALWSAGRAEQLPFADASFELVISFFAAHHFGSISEGIQEMARVATPKGQIWLVTVAHDQMRSCLEYEVFPELLEIDLCRVPDVAKLAELLRGCGLWVGKRVLLYERRRLSWRYFEMVRKKYRSGLRLLKEEDFRRGVARLKARIIGGPGEVEEIMCTALIASWERPTRSLFTGDPRTTPSRQAR